MRLNDNVKLKNPMNDAERQARFVLLDDPEEIAGQGFDIRLVCELPFPPIERVSDEN